MKWIVGFLLLVLLVLQYQLWLSKDGARATFQLSRAIEMQEQENQRLRVQNDILAAEIEDLKTGLDAVEERARTDLGMIREGETFVQIIKSRDK